MLLIFVDSSIHSEKLLLYVIFVPRLAAIENNIHTHAHTPPPQVHLHNLLCSGKNQYYNHNHHIHFNQPIHTDVRHADTLKQMDFAYVHPLISYLPVHYDFDS